MIPKNFQENYNNAGPGEWVVYFAGRGCLASYVDEDALDVKSWAADMFKSGAALLAQRRLQSGCTEYLICKRR